jgi:hypothetical protein
MATNAETSGGDKPLGPVAAVFYAAGIGSVVLGLLTLLAEANESIKDTLQLSDPVGPLSGKTIGASIVFFVAWGILHLVMKDHDPPASRIFTWTGVMVGIGVLLTFPILFQAFAAE